jgi:hypothetical protein
MARQGPAYYYYYYYLNSDWIRTGRYGDRIPVGAIYFAHVQIGPGANPASCTMGAGSFLEVKRPGRGADDPPTPSAEVENEYSYTSNPPLGPGWPVIGWPLPYHYYYLNISRYCDWLRDGRSGDRIPVEARFSAPVQIGSGATHPASCTMGTGSFPGVESGRVVTMTPHPLLVP